jgi:hypothetical protein
MLTIAFLINGLSENIAILGDVQIARSRTIETGEFAP